MEVKGNTFMYQQRLINGGYHENKKQLFKEFKTGGITSESLKIMSKNTSIKKKVENRQIPERKKTRLTYKVSMKGLNSSIRKQRQLDLTDNPICNYLSHTQEKIIDKITLKH